MNLNKKLLSGSLILMIYFNVYNALNFVFHIIMARLLSTSDYGILATLFSIIYALSIFSESIQTILVKYTTEESDKGKIKNILYRSLKRAFVISSIIFVLYAILSIPMSSFLKISYLLLLFNGLMVFGAFILPVTRGILQGRKKFFSLGNNLLIETGIKLLLASTFVFIGFNVFGAMIGTFIGVFTAFALSFISLREVIFSKEKKALTEGIYAYSKPTFFALTILLVFYSFDIILAKIYFNPELAGAYALASILAKTIFFGTQPISKAMFPLSAEKNNTKKQSDDIFKSALTLLLGAISLALLPLARRISRTFSSVKGMLPM